MGHPLRPLHHRQRPPWTLQARASGFFVLSRRKPENMATLTVNKTTAVPGESVAVTAGAGPANTRDWIGLYLKTAPNGNYLDWKYLNGLQTPPGTGMASATVNFAMPSTEGTHNFRFFSNDSLNLLATSPDVVVATAPPPPPPPPTETTVSIPAGKTLLIYRFE